MKVVQNYAESEDYRQFLRITIDGETVFCVHDDEPEDSNLGRAFSPCFNIGKLLERAYYAGKNGESFELVIEDINIDDFFD